MTIPDYLKKEPIGDYERRSSDDEDHQVASLDQQRSSNKKLHTDTGTTPKQVYAESGSAKKPGRKQFNLMLDDVEAGKITVIFTWDLSRLSRNPVDSGRLNWLLQNGILKAIVTPQRIYLPEDNVLLMNVEFGMANQYLRDLSRNVKRGLWNKANKNWYVGSAKPGYMFDPLAKQGEKDLVPIPGTYELIERAWREMMTGKCRVAQVLERLNNEWGYRTPIRGKLGGKPMFLSEIYEMFHDRFYMGEFEYPKKSGEWHKWRGKPMLTEEEFMRVQMLLGGKYLPKPKHREFSFTCLIKCVCGSAVTAEEKWQTICTICHEKFSSLNRDACPKCNTRIEEMDNPTVLHYVYYHCTRKLNPDCVQRSIRLEDLELQVDEILSKSAISDEFRQWALKYFNELNTEEIQDRNIVLDGLHKNYDSCIKRLDNLVKLKISPDNCDGSLLSDEEFKSQKEFIVNEKRALEARMGTTGQRIENWIDNLEKALDFAVQARHKFSIGTIAEKRDILATIGSNLILEDGKLHCKAQGPYCFLEEIVKVEPTASAEFEPGKRKDMTPQLESLWLQNLSVQRRTQKFEPFLEI